MNPILALGQIIVSIALIAAILLQARGTGLSGTFGGDSAVYRSRRGVERRLWQFTIVLLVLFVVFSLASVHPRAQHDRLTAAPRATRGAPHRSLMTRTDTFVVGTLVLVLALVAALIGVPALQLSSSTSPTRVRARRHRSRARDAAVRRGRARRAVIGHAAHRADAGRSRPRRPCCSPASCATARTARIVPDLAERWSVDKTGRTWTVDLRDDAVWHDGQPVTSDDVLFTIETLQDPSYTGPSSTSWNEVTVSASGPHRVVFTLRDAPRWLPAGRSPSRLPRRTSWETCRSTPWRMTRSASSRSGPARSPSSS